MRKVPLSKKQKRAEKIKKTLIHVSIWLLGLLIVIALGVFAVRGFGIKTVIIDQSMNPTLQNEDVVLLNKLSYKIGSPKRMDVVAVRIGASENSPTYVRRIIGLPRPYNQSRIKQLMTPMLFTFISHIRVCRIPCMTRR